MYLSAVKKDIFICFNSSAKFIFIFYLELQLLFKKAKSIPELFDYYKKPTSNLLFEEFGINLRDKVSGKIAL